MTPKQMRKEFRNATGPLVSRVAIAAFAGAMTPVFFAVEDRVMGFLFLATAVVASLTAALDWHVAADSYVATVYYAGCAGEIRERTAARYAQAVHAPTGGEAESLRILTEQHESEASRA